MNGKRSLLIKLMLITIMVLQPVGVAFSMKMMSHHMGGASDMGQHTGMMDHDDRQCAGEHAVHIDQAHLDAEVDDCASNAACPMASCGADLFTYSLFIPKIGAVSICASLHHSWVGISLPTEIRPPRYLIG